MLERLTEVLESITGEDPISNGRRLQVLALIYELMFQEN